jgi:adenylosuccinate synthase
MAGDKKIEQVPYDITRGDLQVLYEEVPGWNTSLNEMRNRDDMPVALKNYLDYIGEMTGIPVIGLSYGPDREETLFF